ncbi:hypothetical protein SLEP1_g36830 [Rubroshorea leprosula]|uniref:Uncharacterized protein n=1 Tax=Rubroshorea leprosula TaxID=152421 RepID=A0AAV5KSY0_9ROSI|nr:hypothetical protein SLEP1_g36830 [Rubroshorea leprosula]
MCLPGIDLGLLARTTVFLVKHSSAADVDDIMMLYQTRKHARLSSEITALRLRNSELAAPRHFAETSDPVTAQLNAMQQQFGVFQLVLAQLLARDNPVDPLIHLLNPAPPVAPQPVQQPANSPVRSVAPTASQAQSHIPPHPQNPPQSGASDVSKRLNNLEKLLTENRNPQPQVPHISTSIPTPLNTKITQEPYPPGFRMPQFETYDGTKDPDDHLHAFFSIMQAQNASDALMCKMFPSTLRGNARTWYYTLRPNSINAYAELATSFATKFSSRRLIKKTTPELMRITQREGESLKNYMNRFNDAMLEVNAFDEAVGVTAVIQGLNHDRFRDNLIKNTPTTFDEVNQRSLKFIKAEEYVLSKPQPPKEARTPTWRDESQSRKKFKPTQNRGPIPVPKLDRPSSSTPQMRPAPPSWTSFTIPRSQILMQIKNKMEMRRPNPIQSPAASRDHTRYCDFHQDHGHTTEECKKQGQAQGSRAPNSRDGVGYQQAPPPLPPPSRVIHMITGGPEAGGTSSKQQKLYVREVKHHNTAQKRKIDEEDWKNQSVTFTSADFEGVVMPHNDPLVTSVIINNCEVQRALIDTGSAPDIMYYHCFESLGLDPALLQKYDGPIYGFNNQPVPVEGMLRLNVAFGSGRTYVTPSVRFLVVRMPSSFNLVIGRPTLTEIRAIVSPPHLCMKFPTPMGIATLRGNQEAARHCYMTSVARSRRNKEVAPSPEAPQPEAPNTQQVMGVELPDNRPEDDPRATPVEEVEEVQLDDNDPSKKTQIGTKLTPTEKEELVGFLKANKDVFAWTSADMPRIPTSVAVHKLSTNPLRKPVAQKRRLFGGERLTAIKEEVQNLLQAGFIRRVDYCEWIANPVMVKKSNGKWRMCIDYTNLNDACPKDCHPMPSIDKLVEAASGNERLSLLDAYSGLIKWAVELGEFQIAFQQRSTIRAQALADFVVECTSNQVEPNSEAETWTLYVDGSSNNKGSGAGAVLTGPDGFRSEHALKFNFQATNNVAEYEALLLGLRLAAEIKVKRLQIYSDSQLVVNQINSMCEVIDPILARYVVAVSELKNRFEKFQLTKIPRAENEHADSLSKLASENSREAKSVYIEILNEPSFQTSGVMEISTDLGAPSWTDPIREYLLNGTVPGDKQEEMKLRRKASRYTLVGDILYKRSYSLPLLRCLTPYEAEYALREVHEGVCGNHVGARTLAHKPAEELTSLTAPWPFAQWGIDLLGPFVKAVGGATHLVVAVDYFTKWVEARPLSCLTSRRIEDFLFSSVICRYGIPNQIIADNGPQFNCNSFRDFCSNYGIKLVFTSVYHPEANGMVESVNKAILEGIKSRLDQLKTKWVDELNNVLWAYRTTSRTATGETPYHLAFGTEAVIPVEIGVPSLRISHFEPAQNERLLRENLDFLDEVREQSRLRTLAYKQRIANLYNKRVRPRNFRVGDLVLRKAGLTGFETRYGKLAPNWEGPYIVTEVPHPGAYILQDAEGKRVPRVWNVNNLKKFHP